ncbi:spermatogenesis-associated protein 20 [Hyaloraphidium curvatum]|nr:spermatogenesis-associated protein 20 [Hyaloraphidium curvatum]
MSSSSSAEPAFTNRLAREKSPYLLQHKHNPVDWYPWGPEAFEKAQKENKPIFLSVGYSTCHWCHVMEHESFESQMTADIMNRLFVNVKVDREEFPSVDKFYMAFVQASTGHGGWPMSVFLTPDLKPFFGGTYFPPDGQGSFTKVLNHIAGMWRTDRDKIERSAGEILGFLSQNGTGSEPPPLSRGQAGGFAERMFGWMEQGFDAKWGGFGRAPKFPTPPQMVFLAKAASRGPALRAVLEDDAKVKALAERLEVSPGDVEEEIGGRAEAAETALEMLRFTLEKIADGGIHDHVGHGFHRYSVDGEWHVPHFEKMLYDEGQLATLYALTHLLSAGGDPQPPEHDFSLVASDILKYLSTNLLSPLGAFFCAEDADSLPTAGASKKREGAFCVWTEKEIRDALVKGAGMGLKEVEVFEHYYDVKSGGNVRPGPTDPHGELRGQNVLRVLRPVAEVAAKFGIPEEEVRAIVAKGTAQLAEERKARPPPHLDDKILVAWNGLAISGLAKCHVHLVPDLASSEYLERALAAADFLRSEMYDPATHQLTRVYREGPGISRGVAEDYAFLIQGLLDLYEALVLSGGDPARADGYLLWAADLQDHLDANFWDGAGCGYFTGARNPRPEEQPGEAADYVLVRTKEDHDGAEPSPSSVGMANLVRLEGMVPLRAKEAGGMGYGERAGKVAAGFAEQLGKFPQTMPQMVAAVEDWRWGLENVVIKDASKEALADLRRSKVLARTFVLATEVTKKYNERVAEALAADRSGVFGVAGKL